MAIRNIRKDNDPILRKTSKSINKIDKRIVELVEDMKETMYGADGVGLAAPQIGVLKRIIVIDIGDGPIVIINPELLDQRGAQIEVEGCLSIPDVSGKVKRPEWVKVKGLNIEGEEIVVEGEDLLSIALCHEIDHLNGVLFTDKVIKE